MPDEIVFSVQALGHPVAKLRELVELVELVPATTSDEEVLRLAGQRDGLWVKCNRDNFLALAGRVLHPGIIILIRRRARALERAALLRLLDHAGETGLRDNINFA